MKSKVFKVFCLVYKYKSYYATENGFSPIREKIFLHSSMAEKWISSKFSIQEKNKIDQTDKLKWNIWLIEIDE